MADNIECDGFSIEEIGKITNDRGESLNDVLPLIAEDLAKFNCAYLIVQYTAVGRPKGVYHQPYRTVRVAMNENYSTSSKIAKYKVFGNWGGVIPDLDADEKNAETYNAFDLSAVRTQIQEAGGVKKYNGQIIAIRRNSSTVYPESPFHAVRLYMDAERRVAEVAHRTLASGFVYNKIIEVNSESVGDDQTVIDLIDAIGSMSSSESSSSTLVVANSSASGSPMVAVTDIGTPLGGDMYSAYYEPVSKEICKAASALPIGLIDSSLVNMGNTSGNTIEELRKMYRERLLGYRNLISRSLAKIFGAEESLFLIDDKLNQSENA